MKTKWAWGTLSSILCWTSQSKSKDSKILSTCWQSSMPLSSRLWSESGTHRGKISSQTSAIVPLKMRPSAKMHSTFLNSFQKRFLIFPKGQSFRRTRPRLKRRWVMNLRWCTIFACKFYRILRACRRAWSRHVSKLCRSFCRGYLCNSSLIHS